jgi:hypothetical protein
MREHTPREVISVGEGVCFAKSDERLSSQRPCASATKKKWVKLRSSMS